MQTCVIFNPSARGEKAEVFCSKIASLYPNCVVRRTAAQGQARSLAAQAVREGFSTVVAAGGDGTANEVVNGIGDVPGGFGSARLGILPLGTVNVFARELGLSLLHFSRLGEIHRLWAGNKRSISGERPNSTATESRRVGISCNWRERDWIRAPSNC